MVKSDNGNELKSESKHEATWHPTVSRRQALATIATTGGFATTGTGVGATANSRTGIIEIVTARAGDGTPYETAKVPQQWLQFEEKTYEQAKKLKRQYLDKGWVENISIGPSKHEVAGKPASVLQIEVNDENIDTPTELNGVPIETVPSGKVGFQDHGSCHYNGSYSNVTGGVAVGEGSGGDWGTSGYAVSKDGSIFLLTANHIWSSCYNSNGNSVYQGGDPLGQIADYHESHDWAIIEAQVSGKTISGQIRVQHSGVFKDVAAYATQNGLRNYKSNNRTINSQGVATGLQSGTITNLSKYFDEECASYNEGVVVSCNGAGGDSGGPIFTYGQAGNAIMIAHTVHFLDPYLDDDLGYACNGAKIEPRKGGWPTWRMVEQDTGGDYNLVTTD